MVGSSLAHGDQAAQLWKSFTWAKTAEGGAAMVAVRVTRNSAGRVATTMTNTTTKAMRKMRTFMELSSCAFPLRTNGAVAIRQRGRTFFAARYEGFTRLSSRSRM